MFDSGVFLCSDGRGFCVGRRFYFFVKFFNIFLNFFFAARVHGISLPILQKQVVEIIVPDQCQPSFPRVLMIGGFDLPAGFINLCFFLFFVFLKCGKYNDKMKETFYSLRFSKKTGDDK